nr:MAG TPA: hypothetical protein [Bacteriophage sp.]
MKFNKKKIFKVWKKCLFTLRVRHHLLQTFRLSIQIL